jgi:hypothetical protein
MMSHLCNRRVREFLILARTWFAFGLPSETGCDKDEKAIQTSVDYYRITTKCKGHRCNFTWAVSRAYK